MRFTFYKQPDSMDCGPTCLRMVAKHYIRSISLQYIREKTQIGKEGVNLFRIDFSVHDLLELIAIEENTAEPATMEVV